MTLPDDYDARKAIPLATGVLDYFPDALAEIARVSKAGNDQHNAGQPLHWARGKSTDEANTLLRHFLERGGVDTDGMLHSAKMAWRALALLQKELEERYGYPLPRSCRPAEPEIAGTIDVAHIRRTLEAGALASELNQALGQEGLTSEPEPRAFQVGDRVRVKGYADESMVKEDDGGAEDNIPYRIADAIGYRVWYDAADLEHAD